MPHSVTPRAFGIWRRSGLLGVLGLFAALAALGLARVDAQRIVILDEDSTKVVRDKQSPTFSVSPDRRGEVRIRISGPDSAAARSARPEPRLPQERGGRYISSDKVAFGQNVIVAADRIIAGNAVAILGSVQVDGVVRGDVVSIGGDVTLGEGAVVRGDCVAVGGGSIRAGRQSQIHGEAVVIGGRIFESPGANIADRVEMNFIPAFRSRPIFIFRLNWLSFLMHFIFIGLFGLLLVRLGSRRWANAVLSLKARGWESLLAGVGAGIVYAILGLPLLVVIILALVALVVGIPLVPLVVFLILIFPVPGYVVTAAVLGGSARGDASTAPAAAHGIGRAYLLGHLLLSLPWLLAALARSIFGVWFGLAGVLLLIAWGVIGLAIAFGWGAFLLSRFGKRLPPALQAQIAAGSPGMGGGGAAAGQGGYGAGGAAGGAPAAPPAPPPPPPPPPPHSGG